MTLIIVEKITTEFHARGLPMWDLCELEKGSSLFFFFFFLRQTSSHSRAHGLVSGSQVGFQSPLNPSVWLPRAVNNLCNELWQPYHTITGISCIFGNLLWFFSHMWLEVSRAFKASKMHSIEQSWTHIFCFGSEDTSEGKRWKEAEANNFQTKPFRTLY